MSNDGSEHDIGPAVCMCGRATSRRCIDSGSALHGLTLTVCSHCGVVGWTWVLAHSRPHELVV